MKNTLTLSDLYNSSNPPISPGPAKIVSEAIDKSVGRGTEVTLTCEAQGSPTPSIVWLKDGRALPSDSRIRHHENLYESTIYISDVRITDNGESSDDIYVFFILFSFLAKFKLI